MASQCQNWRKINSISNSNHSDRISEQGHADFVPLFTGVLKLLGMVLLGTRRQSCSIKLAGMKDKPPADMCKQPALELFEGFACAAGSVSVCQGSGWCPSTQLTSCQELCTEQHCPTNRTAACCRGGPRMGKRMMWQSHLMAARLSCHGQMKESRRAVTTICSVACQCSSSTRLARSQTSLLSGRRLKAKSPACSSEGHLPLDTPSCFWSGCKCSQYSANESIWSLHCQVRFYVQGRI